MPTDATSNDGARVVLITGAGRGLGAEYAHLFAADGHPVVVTDIDDETARATADAIVAGGGQAIGLHLDVTDEASADVAVRAARELFGSVDILINNAGIWGDYEMQGCLSQDLDKWRALSTSCSPGRSFAAAPRLAGCENAAGAASSTSRRSVPTYPGAVPTASPSSGCTS